MEVPSPIVGAERASSLLVGPFLWSCVGRALRAESSILTTNSFSLYISAENRGFVGIDRELFSHPRTGRAPSATGILEDAFRGDRRPTAGAVAGRESRNTSGRRLPSDLAATSATVRGRGRSKCLRDASYGRYVKKGKPRRHPTKSSSRKSQSCAWCIKRTRSTFRIN